jgi:elongation factor Ts
MKSPSTEEIKKLREATSAGVMDCRQALVENGGDMKKAEEWLRKKGIQKADKKADREVKVGAVFAYTHHTGRVGSMLALACETDFVAKTDAFQKLGKELAMQVAAQEPANVEELLAQEYIRDSSKIIKDLIKETIGVLGENIQVLEFKIVKV